MKKKLLRLTAVLMFGCMLAGSIPQNLVYAEEAVQSSGQDAQSGGETQDSGEDSQTEDQTTGVDGSAGTDQDDETGSGNASSADDQNAAQTDGTDTEGPADIQNTEEAVQPQQETEQEVTKDGSEKSQINFVFVESPYLETPGTERIVVSIGDGTETADSAALTVKNQDGEEAVWDLSLGVEGVYLFEHDFDDESATGTYEVVSMSLQSADGEENLLFSDYDVEANFGVNEEYSGIEELQPLDEEAAAEEAADADTSDAVEATIAEIDPEHIEESTEQIVDALQEAEEETETSDTVASADTASVKARTASRTTTVNVESIAALGEAIDTLAKNSSGDIVVALDPGHDSKHTGASYGGLKEHELTLKIAQYCKAELETYSGVTVYMTRTSAACPYPDNKSSGGDIGDRVQAAVKAGADIYVSIHLNSSTSSSAKGAEVIVPNNNWKPSVAQEGRELAQAILDELQKVGLSLRPNEIYSKDTTENERYEDGSLSDYFSVQIYAKEAGIPGIIVEHAFLTNSGDRTFLDSDADLKKLGVADATGIANYLGLSKGEWKTVNGKKYYYEGGKMVTGEKKISGAWYYFASNGVMQTGFVNLGSKVVYYDSNGQMVRGAERKIDGEWYYFNPTTGARSTGFVNLGSKTVYYDSEGKMVRGEERKVGNNWYYFDKTTGARATGFVNLGSKVVYYDTNGAMVRSGEKKINGNWYYLDKTTGARATGFLNLGSKTVYYDSNGVMVRSGEKKINGNWYYLDKVTGAVAKGFYDLGNKVVYYDTNGAMVRGEERKISNSWYYFDAVTGARASGFVNLGTKVVYYDASGKMLRSGEIKINGYWYYLDKTTGARAKGFVNLGSKTVYYDSNGRMVRSGKTQINGKTYYLDKTTGAVTMNGFVDHEYYGSNGALVAVSNYGSVFYKIAGSSTVTVDQMARYYKKSNKAYPTAVMTKGGAATIDDFAKIVYEEAAAEGIKAEVVWAQIMKETGYLQFGGQVKIEQYNFAGLGATDNGAAGASFPDVRTGIRAQVQHLKAYGSTAGLKNTCVDPRFNLVTRGSALYVEILGTNENPKGAGWATAKGYGLDLAKMIDNLKAS